MTGLVGSLVEAWGEVRVHRARVVLSLVGVVLAVFAMTVVTAAGTLARQVVLESSERAGGRTTTMAVSAFGTEQQPSTEQLLTAYEGIVDRFDIGWSSTVQQTGLDLSGATAPGQVGSPAVGGVYANVSIVDPAYGVIHRITPVRGRYLAEGDAQRLAPAAVVNETYLDQLGMSGAAPPFRLMLPGDPDVTIVVVGVLEGQLYSSPELHVLREALPLLPATLTAQGSTPTLEIWVPPETADAISAAVPTILSSQGLSGEAFPMSDPGLPRLLGGAQWAIRGLSVIALVLGATGVLNVGIVTVRQRVREIGIRRALGASSSRVFAAVVLESVCAMALAGLVGVALAVAVVVNLPLDTLLGDLGITDVPAFPVSAAVEAFLAATAVGALAGLVPATIAVRSKVIDAIRY